MNKRVGFSGVGLSSLMAIAAVLCLGVFTLLCIADAKADRRMSEKHTQSIVAYYEADCQAEEIISKLRRGEIPSGVTCMGDEYSFGCRISDSLTLFVRAAVTADECEILDKKTVAAGAWQQDDSLPVWQGDLSEGDN